MVIGVRVALFMLHVENLMSKVCHINRNPHYLRSALHDGSRQNEFDLKVFGNSFLI